MLSEQQAKSIEKNVGCIAQAMSIIGTKWTALILRDLFLSPQRFCQLEKSIPDINPRILSKRLDYLEEQSIVSVSFDPPFSSRKVYTLTKKGEDLLPILKSMADWGLSYQL